VNLPVNNLIIIIFRTFLTEPHQNITSVYMNLINISDRYWTCDKPSSFLSTVFALNDNLDQLYRSSMVTDTHINTI